MRRLAAPLAVGIKLCATTALAIASAVAVASPAGATTVVPLVQTLRACDFTPAINVQSKGNGIARADITATTSKTVIAHVQLLAATPGTHYTVRLIQAPNISASCTAGDSGVVSGGMDTNAAGAATLTLQDAISENSSGAWIFVDRPAQHSQTPAEFYTSAFIATL